MVKIPVDDVGTIGVIKDLPAYQLPPEAWSLAENMRCRDNAMEKLLGYTECFPGPSASPHYILPIKTGSSIFWVYTDLVSSWVWDGADHTDITQAGGYNANNTRDWNGTILGGIPIINNGNDAPQYWPAISAATDMADLLNWPEGLKAKVVRAIGNFLIAINITEDGTNHPHRVRWSSAAEPGTLPFWDNADPAREAGELDVADVESGVFVDMMPLRGRMFLYKEGGTHVMQYVGGQNVMAVDSFLETFGILAPRCVTPTGDGQRHFVVGQDDVIVHDGNTAQSILTKKARKWLFNSIDQDNYRNTFVFTNPLFKEVWLCFPEQGSDQPTRALIWNSEDGQLTESPIDFRYAASGTVELASAGTWDLAAGTWDTDDEEWSRSQRRKSIAARTDASQFVQLDSTNLRNDTVMPTTLQRVGLSLVGRKRDGSPIVDWQSQKMCTRIWPKISGGPVDVRIGSQVLVDGPVTWSVKRPFNPLVALWLDFIVQGRAIALEFSSAADVSWTLEGYQIEIAPLGEF